MAAPRLTQFDGGHLGGEGGHCGLGGLPDGVPGAAAAAAAAGSGPQAQCAGGLVEPEEFHRLAQGVQGAGDPGVHVLGVQVVQGQQAGDEFVVQQRGEGIGVQP